MLAEVSKKLSEVKISERKDCAGKSPAAAADKKAGKDMPPLIDLTASEDENPCLGN